MSNRVRFVDIPLGAKYCLGSDEGQPDRVRVRVEGGGKSTTIAFMPAREHIDFTDAYILLEGQPEDKTYTVMDSDRNATSTGRTLAEALHAAEEQAKSSGFNRYVVKFITKFEAVTETLTRVTRVDL